MKDQSPKRRAPLKQHAILGGGAEAQNKTWRKDGGRWALEDEQKSEPSSWAGEDAERTMLHNGRQFLKRLSASHTGPADPCPKNGPRRSRTCMEGRPDTQRRQGTNGRTAERSLATRVTDTLTSSC